MNLQKRNSVFVIILSFFVGVCLGRWFDSFDKKPMIEKSQQTIGPKEAVDAVTKDISEHKEESAIAKALINENHKEMITPSLKEFGIDQIINIKSGEELVKRALENKNLGDALKQAKEQKILIFAGNKFDIGTGWVEVNINAFDQEIIDFILGKKEEK